MTSVYTSELAAAAADRGQDAGKLRATLEAGPYGAEDAQAGRLIDRTGQVSEAEADIRAKTDNAELLDFATYKSSAASTLASGGSTIAVINAEGDIVTG